MVYKGRNCADNYIYRLTMINDFDFVCSTHIG